MDGSRSQHAFTLKNTCKVHLKFQVQIMGNSYMVVTILMDCYQCPEYYMETVMKPLQCFVNVVFFLLKDFRDILRVDINRSKFLLNFSFKVDI